MTIEIHLKADDKHLSTYADMHIIVLKNLILHDYLIIFNVKKIKTSQYINNSGSFSCL